MSVPSSQMLARDEDVLESSKNTKEELVEAAHSPTEVPSRTKTASPYFLRASSNNTSTLTTPLESPEKKVSKSKGGTLNCIPFPPLSSPHFGLLQEKLANDPFRLIVGVSFLIRTKGRDSIPIFYELMSKYPTIEDLANARKADIVGITRHLGLQNERADTYIRYAKTFLSDPPQKGRRYRVENYPFKNAHQGIAKGEILADNEEDPREGGWEIGHLTKGIYTLDSWRIFCRDKLRGLADGWNGEGAKEGFQPEWMRVLPLDKELMAFLRWCWLREGWEWNATTGEREVASKELIDACNEGRLVWEWRGPGSKSGSGHWRIL